MLLKTKLHVPELKNGIVSRTRLISQLEAGLDKPLILLCAGAGYGKTTLLSQFAATTKLPMIWYQLDVSDNDPAIFFDYLIESTASSIPGLGAETYCISVDALGDGNDLVLIPGGWTYPTPGEIQQMAQVTVPADATDVDFGWDYQFLPAPQGEAPACFFQALRTINCRESDYEASSLIAILEPGESGKLIALSPDYSHGKFEIQDLKTCWIWFGLLGGPENPQECEVPIVDPPPAPIEEPGDACRSDLPKDACEARGGTWQPAALTPGVCICP